MKSLTITQMQDGGYLVLKNVNNFGEPSQMLYASTTIDEALKYVRDTILAHKQENEKP